MLGSIHCITISAACKQQRCGRLEKDTLLSAAGRMSSLLVRCSASPGWLCLSRCIEANICSDAGICTTGCCWPHGICSPLQWLSLLFLRSLRAAYRRKLFLWLLRWGWAWHLWRQWTGSMPRSMRSPRGQPICRRLSFLLKVWSAIMRLLEQ